MEKEFIDLDNKLSSGNKAPQAKTLDQYCKCVVNLSLRAPINKIFKTAVKLNNDKLYSTLVNCLKIQSFRNHLKTDSINLLKDININSTTVHLFALTLISSSPPYNVILKDIKNFIKSNQISPYLISSLNFIFWEQNNNAFSKKDTILFYEITLLILKSISHPSADLKIQLLFYFRNFISLLQHDDLNALKIILDLIYDILLFDIDIQFIKYHMPIESFLAFFNQSSKTHFDFSSSVLSDSTQFDGNSFAFIDLTALVIHKLYYIQLCALDDSNFGAERVAKKIKVDDPLHILLKRFSISNCQKQIRVQILQILTIFFGFYCSLISLPSNNSISDTISTLYNFLTDKTNVDPNLKGWILVLFSSLIKSRLENLAFSSIGNVNVILSDIFNFVSSTLETKKSHQFSSTQPHSIINGSQIFLSEFLKREFPLSPTKSTNNDTPGKSRILETCMFLLGKNTSIKKRNQTAEDLNNRRCPLLNFVTEYLPFTVLCRQRGSGSQFGVSIEDDWFVNVVVAIINSILFKVSILDFERFNGEEFSGRIVKQIRSVICDIILGEKEEIRRNFPTYDSFPLDVEKKEEFLMEFRYRESVSLQSLFNDDEEPIEISSNDKKTKSSSKRVGFNGIDRIWICICEIVEREVEEFIKLFDIMTTLDVAIDGDESIPPPIIDVLLILKSFIKLSTIIDSLFYLRKSNLAYFDKNLKDDSKKISNLITEWLKKVVTLAFLFVDDGKGVFSTTNEEETRTKRRLIVPMLNVMIEILNIIKCNSTNSIWPLNDEIVLFINSKVSLYYKTTKQFHQSIAKRKSTYSLNNDENSNSSPNSPSIKLDSNEAEDDEFSVSIAKVSTNHHHLLSENSQSISLHGAHSTLMLSTTLISDFYGVKLARKSEIEEFTSSSRKCVLKLMSICMGRQSTTRRLSGSNDISEVICGLFWEPLFALENFNGVVFCLSQIQDHFDVDAVSLLVSKIQVLLTGYEQEKNPWAWLLVLKTLRIMVPKLYIQDEHVKLTIGKVIFFLHTKAQTLGSRVYREYCCFLIDLYKHDPEQTFFNSFSFADKMENAACLTLLEALVNENYLVRLNASFLMGVFVNLIDQADHGEIFDDVDEIFSKIDGMTEGLCVQQRFRIVYTQFLAMSCLAAASREKCFETLMAMLKRYSKSLKYFPKPILLKILISSLENAKFKTITRTYDTFESSSSKMRQMIFKEFLHSIIVFDDGGEVFGRIDESIPFELFGFLNLTQFLFERGGSLICRWLFQDEAVFENNMEMLERLIGESVGKIIRRDLGLILVTNFPHLKLFRLILFRNTKRFNPADLITFINDENVWPDAVFHLLTLIKSKLDDNDRKTLQSLNNSEYCAVVQGSDVSSLVSIYAPEFKNALWISEIVQAISTITELVKGNWSQSFAAQVLQKLRKLLATTVLNDNRTRILIGFKLFFLIDSQLLAHPILFFWSVSFLFDLVIKEESLAYDCCQLITSLSLILLENDLQAFQSQLVFILTGLTKLASIGDVFVLAIEKIISASQTSSSEDIKVALGQLNRTFLAETNLKLFNTISKFDKEFGTFIDNSQLVELLRSVRSKSAVLTSLNYLFERMQHPSFYEEGRVDCCDDLMSAITTVLNQHQSDQDIGVNVAACMGRLLPFVSTGFGSKNGVPEKSGLYIGHCFLIRTLQEYLFNSDIDISCKALEILIRVLSTKMGIQVLKSLDSRCRSSLNFLCSQSSKVVEQNYSKSVNYSLINSLIVSEEPFDVWIVALCKFLLLNFKTDEIFMETSSMNEVFPKFSQDVLPYIIHLSLLSDVNQKVNLKSTLSRSFSLFFSEKRDKSKTTTLLQTVDFLRTQTNAFMKTSFDRNLWLDIDYMQVAKAALDCQMYSNALMYFEIYCYLKGLTNLLLSEEQLQFLLEIYENFQEAQDGFDGVSAISSSSLLQRLYQHDGEWKKLMDFEDTRLSTFNLNEGSTLTTQASGILRSMNGLGNHFILENFVKGMASTIAIDQQSNDVIFESLWRNSTFSSSLLEQLSFGDGLNQRFFNTLHKLNNNEDALFQVDKTYRYWLRKNLHKLVSVGFEKERELSSNLLMIVELEDGVRSIRTSNSANLWKVRLPNIESNGFQFKNYVEPILALKVSMSDVLFGGKNMVRDGVSHSLLLLDYTKKARKAGFHHIAQNTLRKLAQIPSIDLTNDEIRLEIDLEKAKLLWSQGDRKQALSKLTGLVSLNIDSNLPKAKILTQIGIWKGETRSADPVRIIEDYFEQALSLSGNFVYGRCHYLIAKFADDQFQQMKSDENFVHGQSYALLDHKLNELKACEEMISSSNSSRKRELEGQRQRLKKQITLDQEESLQYASSLDTFLSKAITGYCKTLAMDNPKWDLVVFRIVTLWFSNQKQDKFKINKFTHDQIKHIPSHKFLGLIYQLSARLDTPDDSSSLDSEITRSFQKTLLNLLQRLLIDHPHHSIFQMLALKNSELDSPKVSLISKQKSVAAKNLLEKVAGGSKKMSELISSYNLLCDAYMELANMKVNLNKGGKGGPISRNLKIMKGDFSGLPVITKDFPIDVTCKYSNIVKISKFKAEYTLVGGVNVPKLIECQGNDGYFYKQLVKSNDDLRQDAVLSSIFKIVRDEQTRIRKASARTYKVIPFSPRTGVLEWIENTCPIGEYLLAAHPMYNPLDLTPSDARKKMHNENNRKGADNKSKLAVFNQICSKLSPVFHHFFFEYFPSPRTWFEKRTAYSTSVATSSILGYVVGLGDRHAQNILVDKKTAEVIHIDLGIAFDQGKLLPTPEQVPFRLTRDIVDGFGITGVDGVFRKCCEETLRVLVSQHFIISTILDVFRYDPLYQWCLSPLKMQQEEGLGDDVDFTGAEKNDNGNKDAERALIVLRKKLAGDLSVQYRVNELLQQASDPKNLSRMFQGWQAWL